MASAAPAIVDKPLSDFHKIGHNTYLFTPESYSHREPLILLFAWMGAAAKHIAKYTVGYRRLFPSARIVLVRNTTRDFFHNEAAYTKLLGPAIEVVKEHVSAGGQVLVHSFSNGGSNQMTELAKAWVKCEGSPFPMRAQVLDSAPGKGGWRRSHAAMAMELPRAWIWKLIGSACIHLFLGSLFVYDLLAGKENMMTVMRRQLDDPSIFDVRAPRVYLYSKGDAMVGDDEVEEHAEGAERRGWKVTRVRFEKSPHAGHLREDEGRYWAAVMDAWEAKAPAT